MKKLFLLLPVLLLAAIDKIEYRGLIHISPVTANDIIKIHTGDTFDIKKIDESIKALYDTGYFQTIKAEREKNTLIFECTEKPTVLKVKTENLSEDLKKILKERNLLPKKGEIYSEEKLDELKEFIKAYYLSKGYFNTVVNIEKEPVNNSIILHIAIKKGEHLIIKEVNFYGNKKIPKADLLDEVENRPRTFLSILPFTNSGKLNIYKLLSDKQSLQNYYLNLGFMDAYVSDPLAESNFDNYTAKIDYRIKEGIRYTVKKVSVEYPGNIRVKLPALHVKKEKYFNISALKKDLEDIKNAFADIGYAYARVYPQIKKQNAYVSITYKVIPGNIVYIRNVIINGNTKTLDRVIRRNIYLAPGEKYSYTDLKDSKNALQRSGYLEDVKIKEKKVSSDKIDLIVNVKEGLSGSLRAGISYGSYSKLGFNFSISEKNVFGSGQSISASADFSSVSRTYKLSLFNPRVFDSKYSMNTSVFDTSFEGISYTSRQKGFTLGVGKSLSRFVGANITYGYTKTSLSDYNTTVYIMPKSSKSYIITTLSYNDTDNYYFPTTGQKASLSLEFAGIGGDEKYIKTVARYKYFYPLLDKSYRTYAVLKYRVIAGMINNNGYLPINEKFYLGGIRSVRGFSTYSISPKDSDGNLIGGKYELITGPELSTPLSIKNKVWLSAFLDYGAVGENGFEIKRSSYGISIDWITPMGPLSFVWAWPIKSETGDDLQRFEFSIGANF
ncbi:outer membrane protein assembly factor BamA [Nautilia sp.]